MRVLALAAASLLVLALTPVEATGQPAEPVRVGGPIPPPQKTKDVKPIYPADAQKARVSGVVVVELTLGEDGKVRNATILRSVPMLDQAALDCVRQWQFTPTVVSGKAVPVLMTVTVNFALDGVPPVPGVPTAAAPVPGPLRLMTIGSLVWEIPVARAAALPRWDIDRQDPPLTLAQAKQIARTWLAQRNPQLAFEVNNINLQRVRRTADVDLWYYQLAFYPTTPEPTMPILRAVVLPDGSIVEPTQLDPSANQPPPGVYTVGQPGVSPPRIQQQVNPRYTQEAMRQKIAGSVAVQFVVGADGTVQNPRIIRSLDATFGLDDEALKAVRQWRFAPGTKDGQPVPILTTAEVVFALR